MDQGSGPPQIAGILISVTGAIVAISRGNFGEFLQGNIGWGEFYIFLCVASWVVFSLLGKAVMSGLSPLASVTYSSLTGTILLFMPALREGLTNCINYSMSDWWNIFYLGFFGTVLGFVWFYEGINQIGPTKAGLFINPSQKSGSGFRAPANCGISRLDPKTLKCSKGAVRRKSGAYTLVCDSRLWREADPQHSHEHSDAFLRWLLMFGNHI
ncbi:MAG: DMT family transporter [Desulfobacterales bacterium]